MKQPPKWTRFWLCCRWGIRGCRIALLVVVLLVVSGFVWFNQIGMPDFAKTMLQDELKNRGLEVEFQRMYWKWFKGIVTEDLTIHPTEGRIGPSISIQTADVDLDLEKLATGEVSVKSIELFQGYGVWRVAPTNESPRTLMIENLNTDIRFLPDDQWQLTHFSAKVQGINVAAAGIITNASFARQERINRSKQQSRAENRKTVENVESRIHRALARLAEFKFASPPNIKVELNADARERGEIEARVSGSANLLESPLGTCRSFQLNGQISRAADTNSPLKASLSLGATAVKTEHGQMRQVKAFVFSTVQPEGHWDVLWNTTFNDAITAKGTAETVRFEGNATCDVLDTNEVLANVSFTFNKLNAAGVRAGDLRFTTSLAGNHRTRQLRHAEFKGRMQEFTSGALSVGSLYFDGLIQTNATGSLTTNGFSEMRSLAPWKLNLNAEGDQLNHAGTKFNSASIGVKWSAPELKIHSFKAEVENGSLDAMVSLHANRRAIEIEAGTDYPLPQIAKLLGPKTARYLAQYGFHKPPVIHLNASLKLPPGELKDLDWKKDLEPNLNAAGNVSAADGDYRGLEFLSAETDFTITNQLLTLPNLMVRRDDGNLRLTYTNDMVSRDYAFGIDSRINPRAIGPLLGKGERRGLEMLDFPKERPLIRGTLWGRWGDLERTGFEALTRMTNVTVRGQHLQRLATHAAMTNGNLILTDVSARRPEGVIRTAKLRIDTGAGRIYLSNVVSGIDFMVIPSIIGPKTAKTVSRYHFLKTPNLIINGEVGTHRDSEKDSNLHFDLRAPHFHWFKFNLTNATARLDWVTNKLHVKDLQADFYGGRMDGDLYFDFDPPVGNDFSFDLDYTNAALRAVIADVSNPTNKLEGRVSGEIHLTSGNTAYWNSWQGYGDIMLTNGVLWDIPVFGLVSPVMNRILPGLNLGNSRAKEAAGKFVMTNSVIYTRDLIIQSPPARLYYNGTIDFDANIKARVEAKMFRDKFLMTRLLDAFTAPITKILEHKVTGTLANPKSEPINELPKILLAPLKPLQAVTDILKGRKNGKKKTPKNKAPGRP